MFTRRLLVCLVTGALLGVVCIIGAQIRSGFEKEALYLFSFWYNRLIMGLAIGLAIKSLDPKRVLARGAIVGFLISFAFFASTGLSDLVGLIAGIFYGMIIEYVGLKFGTIKQSD
jgi:hypothetical protein